MSINMKRPAGSEFDDSGNRWFQSPHYKEYRTDIPSEDPKDGLRRVSNIADTDKRDYFYDLFRRVNLNREFRLDIDELNRNLNFRLEDVDNLKIKAIFEDLNAKIVQISRGKKAWTDQETQLLAWILVAYSTLEKKDHYNLDDRDYETIDRIFPGRNGEQCKARWQSLLKANLSKASWTQEEDRLLTDIITEKGPKKWKEIAIELNHRMEGHKILREGKQCRERWINHLDPSINRGAWTHEEDQKLLEAHLQIGKKWAEIAKILKNRTENSVKNRWNSLIRKGKTEYGMDSDSISTVSDGSTRSMEDLERGIAQMILTKKKGTSFFTEQILEVPEEDSPGYNSDFSMEPSMTNNNDMRNSSKNAEDINSNSNLKKGAPAKKKPIASVKNSLRDMVTEEIQSQPTNSSFQPMNSNNPGQQNSYYGAQGNEPNLDQQDYRHFMYGKPNGFTTNNFSDQVLSTQGPYNSNPTPLINQHQGGDTRNSIFNMPNDALGLNMWRNNLSNMNVFGQNAPQPNASPKLFGFYNPANFTNLNFSPALLPSSNGREPIRFNAAIANYTTSSNPHHTQSNDPNNAQKPSSNELPKLMEPKSYKLADKTLEQINPNEEQPNLHYAVVDMASGNIYLMDPVTQENYPPPFNIFKQQRFINQVNTNSTNLSGDVVGNSPALNYSSWASPNLGTNAFLSHPIFNNPLTTLAFSKNQFSPNLNLFHESPKLDPALFGSTPKMEGRSMEWTPENMTRSLFNGLQGKPRMGNSRGDTPPEIKFSNGGFLTKRINEKGKMMTNDGLKYNSPSSFLQSGQSNHMSRNVVNQGR